jgi:hypothetical protein
MKSISQQIDDGLIDLAWSLWTELGVAGTFRRHENCLISLEELIILTAVIADSDPRLRDEALDWCVRYHHLVSISRLKTLVKKMGSPILESFSIFSSTLNTMAPSNWPIFSGVTPLKCIPSGKSILPNLNAPALLQLRLRTFFGVGARADLFTYFLTENKNDFTASDVVTIGYSKRSLADLLDQLVQSGFLVSTIIRNQKKYELVKSEQLKRVVGELPEVAPPWYQILELLIPLRKDLHQSKEKGVTTQVVMVRSDLERMKNLLALVHLSPPSLDTDLDRYWKIFSEWLGAYVKAIAQGNFGGHFKVNSSFEKTIYSLMQDLYLVNDCLDGLEYILSCSKEDLVKHSQVFGEIYQICLNYVNELKAALQRFLDFPFHHLMDDRISDIVYMYSKSHLQPFLEFSERFTSLKQVINPREALKQYETLQDALNKLHEFIYEFRERLKKIHMLTLSPKLFKRQAVLQLYSS